MNTIRLLILAGLFLNVSCKTRRPQPHVGSPSSAIPVVMLRPGTYRDELGGRLLTVRKEHGELMRVKITAKDTPDQFVDLIATPQTVGAELLELIGINVVTRKMETLRITVQPGGGLRVERLNVPFPGVIDFRTPKQLGTNKP